jgi:hypothetical protein
MNAPHQPGETPAPEHNALEAPQAETLCRILNGLFHCMRDLDSRVANLEGLRDSLAAPDSSGGRDGAPC